MTPELRKKIIAYNKAAAERKEKAGDLDALVSAILKHFPSYLMKMLPEEVLEVLKKYGYEE